MISRSAFAQGMGFREGECESTSSVLPFLGWGIAMMLNSEKDVVEDNQCSGIP